jgi:hypothetical protein
VKDREKTWKNGVEAAFREICEVLNKDRCLDHEIRAVELLRTEKFKKDGDYHRPYTIIRKPSNKLGGKNAKAFVLILKNGAEIRYMAEGTKLEQMIAVGHELGHIYLDHLSIYGDRNSVLMKKDELQEKQASYFS